MSKVNKEVDEILNTALKLYQTESKYVDYGTEKMFFFDVCFLAACKLLNGDIEKDYDFMLPSETAIDNMFMSEFGNLDDIELTRVTLKETKDILLPVFSIIEKEQKNEYDFYDFVYGMYMHDPTAFRSALSSLALNTNEKYESTYAYQLMANRSIANIKNVIEECSDEVKDFLYKLNTLYYDVDDIEELLQTQAESDGTYLGICFIAALWQVPRYQEILKADGLNERRLNYYLGKYGITDTDAFISFEKVAITKSFQKTISPILYNQKDPKNTSLEDLVEAIYKEYRYDMNKLFEEVLDTNNFFNTRIAKLLFSEDQKQDFEKIKEKQKHIEYIEDMETLQSYGVFLDELDYPSNPAIGREKEIKEVLITLLTPEKSAMIVGEAGVGKTALAEGIAYKLKKGKVPKQLRDTKILKVTASKLVEGAKYVGVFEARMEELFSILKKYPNIILNIDEIHTAIGLGQGSHGNLDFANILKPYLDRGQVRLIASTTDYEYEEIVNGDEAFRRRFEKVEVKEPNDETLHKILDKRIDVLEENYDIGFNFDYETRKTIINEIIKLTNKSHRVYNDNQNNPDLSISIISKTFAYAAYDGKDNVEVDDIINAIDDSNRIYDEAKVMTKNHLRKIEPLKEKPKTKIIKLDFLQD